MNLLFLGDFFYDYDYLAPDVDSLSKWIYDNGYQTIVNLEGPITESAKKIKKRGEHLKQGDKAIEVLKKWNVIAVCLANNHIMDFGEDGLIDTINILSKNNIQCFGAGTNIKEAMKPLIISSDKDKVAILNYAWNIEEAVYANKYKSGCSPRKDKLILEQLKTLHACEQFSKIICIMHWGFEYNPLPMPKDIQLAHTMISCGATHIIGGHPHVRQPIEKYENAFIIYSLGNAYFSSFRKEFSEVNFNDENESLCNFSLAVGLSDDIIKYLEIHYDQNSNLQTYRIRKESDMLNMVNYNVNSREYAKLCAHKSANYNPILNSNEIISFLKVVLLILFYKSYGFIKKMLNNQLGEKFKSYLKS